MIGGVLYYYRYRIKLLFSRQHDRVRLILDEDRVEFEIIPRVEERRFVFANDGFRNIDENDQEFN